MDPSRDQFKGFGLGLRPEHFSDFVDGRPDVDWLEILSDNYLVPGGRPLQFLDLIRSAYPMCMHGVGLNLGSIDAIDKDYLKALKELSTRVEPLVISDHLCWTGCEQAYLHDLLPLPFSQESIDHVVNRIDQVQTFLGRQIAIENLSSYLQPRSSLSEPEFIAEIAMKADCLILLDINNVFVSSENHGFDPIDYLQALPSERVCQIHLAGHSFSGCLRIDTHDQAICDEVFDLYRASLFLLGPVPVMIERDDNIPPLPELLTELHQVRTLQRDYFNQFAPVPEYQPRVIR